MAQYTRLLVFLLMLLLLEACGKTQLQKTKTDSENTQMTNVVEYGQQLFHQYRCVKCHGENGVSGMADLSKVAAKYSADQVKTWIVNPRSMKSATTMPSFNMLSDDQLHGLAMYVLSLSEK